MEDAMILLKLLGFILLGILSAALSYYKKNYYVGVFDDILGRDEDGSVASRVGRGFLYGVFFPIYFSLLISGLVILIGFLIAIGIVAAIAFVLVWFTEKILPHEWFGTILLNLFNKIGLKGAPEAPQPAAEAPSGAPSCCSCTPSTSEPGTCAGPAAEQGGAASQAEDKKD
jgi:hypothetical protein